MRNKPGMIRSFIAGFLSSAFSSSEKNKNKNFENFSGFYLLHPELEKNERKIENVKIFIYLQINCVLDQMFLDNHRVYILDFDMVGTSVSF
jgi:hypothetical protein